MPPKAKPKTKEKPPRPRSLLTKEGLTQMQAEYVENRASGLDKQTSARLAGSKNPGPSATEMENLPKIREAIKHEHLVNARMAGISREDVLMGLKRAIEDAQVLADPMAQIAGWREIGKMCGYYAPEVKRIELSGSQEQFVKRLESMSDDELLRMAEEAQGRVIEGEVIDG